MTLALSWGLQPPAEAIAAWGARGIADPEASIGLLPDRQDCKGEEPARLALAARLNGKDAKATVPGRGALSAAFAEWKRIHKSSGVPGDGPVHTLYDDGECIVKACARGYGYVMVGAWLLSMPAEEDAFARAERVAAQSVFNHSEDCKRNVEEIASVLTRGWSVRFGPFALETGEQGSLRLVACEPSDYTPVEAPKAERKPPAPRNPRTEGSAWGYWYPRADWAKECREVEGRNAQAKADARRADWSAWLAAKPSVRCTVGTIREQADGSIRREDRPAARLLLRALREGWSPERLSEALHAEYDRVVPPPKPRIVLPWVPFGTNEKGQQAAIAKARKEGRDPREALQAFRATFTRPEVYVVFFAKDGRIRLYDRNYGLVSSASREEAKALIERSFVLQSWAGYGMEGIPGDATWIAHPQSDDAKSARKTRKADAALAAEGGAS